MVNSSQELDGRSLRVNYGPPPPKRDDSSFRGSRNASRFDNPNRIHVSNLAWGVDDLTLENLFREHGNVVEAKVVYDRESGRSRGFGFITYNSAEEVNNAIQSLDGTVSSHWPFIFMRLFFKSVLLLFMMNLVMLPHVQLNLLPTNCYGPIVTMKDQLLWTWNPVHINHDFVVASSPSNFPD